MEKIIINNTENAVSIVFPFTLPHGKAIDFSKKFKEGVIKRYDLIDEGVINVYIDCGKVNRKSLILFVLRELHQDIMNTNVGDDYSDNRKASQQMIHSLISDVVFGNFNIGEGFTYFSLCQYETDYQLIDGQFVDITNKEVLTFEQCMEKYGKHMSPEQRAELWVNALHDNPDDKELRKAWKEWLFPKSAKKEKLNGALIDYLFWGRSSWHTDVNTKKERILAENQLKNLAPFLSGNSMIKSDDADNPVGHLTINNRYYGVVHLKEDFVFSKTEGVCQIKNVGMSVENGVHDVWYAIGSDKQVHSSNIERKATEQEIINHLSPYKIHQYITTGFNNRVQQITDIKLNDKNQVIYELDSSGIYLVESVINREATKGETLQHQHGLEKGDWVLLEMGDIRWSQPRKFKRFNNDGALIAYPPNDGGSSSYGYVFKKLPKDFDINKDVIKLK